MQDRDLIISQIRQRLEILYQMIEELESGGGGEPGSSNYNDLTNKPSINNITLTGNKTTTQLGLASAAQINQTNTNISNLTNTVNDIFTPDNITLNDGGFFPQIAMEWISLHKPISVNDNIYYFIEETDVDYLYASIPTNGAYPSTSYLRIMKDNRKVKFHNTIIETAPIANSDNLVTSGGTYAALEGKVDKEAGKGLSTNDFTTIEKEALNTINDAFPYLMQRGEYTLNENSELTFDTLMETKYYRFTGTAIGNPIPGSYGIVINIRYTSYAVQLCFSHLLAADPTRLVFRLGINMSSTPLWRGWQEVSTTVLS